MKTNYYVSEEQLNLPRIIKILTELGLSWWCGKDHITSAVYIFGIRLKPNAYTIVSGTDFESMSKAAHKAYIDLQSPDCWDYIERVEIQKDLAQLRYKLNILEK